MASKRPTFTTNGTHRAVTSGRKVALSTRPQSGWPYAVDCPNCPAKRYERCYKWQGVKGVKLSEDDIKTGATDDVRFIYIKDTPCAERVRLVSKRDDNEGIEGDVIGNDYSGCDL